MAQVNPDTHTDEIETDNVYLSDGCVHLHWRKETGDHRMDWLNKYDNQDYSKDFIELLNDNGIVGEEGKDLHFIWKKLIGYDAWECKADYNSNF